MVVSSEDKTPFDPTLFLGSVAEIHPDHVIANLPASAAPPEARSRIRVSVGDFVFVECEQHAILGRVVETKLTPTQRLNVQPAIGADPAHLDPFGKIQLLATWHVSDREIIRGLASHPRLGDRIFLAAPEFLKKLGDGGNSAADDSSGELMEIGVVSISSAPVVKVTPKALVRRHCCVLGATGGGKSWTVASLIEALLESHCQILLFDPTGEFSSDAKGRITLGREDKGPSADFGGAIGDIVGFSYRHLLEEDLFVLLNPSPGIQRPKLCDAIRSLKLSKAFYENGEPKLPGKLNFSASRCLRKEGSSKAAYQALQQMFPESAFGERCDFDIKALSEQIGYECVWEDGGTGREPNRSIWGGRNDNSYNHCSNLISRLDSLLRSPELAFMLDEKQSSATDRIEIFVKKGDPFLHVRLDKLSFQHSVREICLNAFGRHLLQLARKGAFLARPLIVVIDEAHQFLNKAVGLEDLATKLDQFGLIAKEGRKYGLHCLLATQRPRDLPDDVLSQIGTMIVHRLTNERDREVVEKACGQLDRSAAAFLPTLQQGEALLVGADFALPVPIHIRRPTNPPKSAGPSFAKPYRQSSGTAVASIAAPDILSSGTVANEIGKDEASTDPFKLFFES